MLMVILDLDLEYAKCLMGQLKRREDFLFDIQLVTTLEHLNKIEHKITLLLMDEKLEGVKVGSHVENIIYLSEGVQDLYHIKRYQSIDRIIAHIEKGCDIEKEELHKLNKGGLVAIYSPIGGCGKTYLATALAERVCESKGKAYYFNFELISSLECNKNPDFYYDLRQRILFDDERWNNYFNKKNGFLSLCTSLYNNELWNVDKEDIEYLISGLRERKEYAYYIFDIGFLNTAMITLLKYCDYWFVPKKMGTIEEIKVKNMRNLIKFREGNSLEEKITEVNIQGGIEGVWRRLVL